MRSRSAAEKILFLLTAFGGLLVIGATAFFALAGSAFVPNLLRHAAGFALGLLVVMLLTRSPERGGRFAALLLPAALVGIVVLLLVATGPSAEERGWGDPEFTIGLLVSVAVASVWRLLGVNPMGPRGDQAPRRRS